MILDMISQVYRSTTGLCHSDASSPSPYLSVSPAPIVRYDNTARLAERLSEVITGLDNAHVVMITSGDHCPWGDRQEVHGGTSGPPSRSHHWGGLGYR